MPEYVSEVDSSEKRFKTVINLIYYAKNISWVPIYSFAYPASSQSGASLLIQYHAKWLSAPDLMNLDRNRLPGFH